MLKLILIYLFGGAVLGTFVLMLGAIGVKASDALEARKEGVIKPLQPLRKRIVDLTKKRERFHELSSKTILSRKEQEEQMKLIEELFG